MNVVHLSSYKIPLISPSPFNNYTDICLYSPLTPLTPTWEARRSSGSSPLSTIQYDMESSAVVPVKLSSQALRLLYGDNAVQHWDVDFLDWPPVYITPVDQVPVGMGGSAVVRKAILRTEETRLISVALKVFHLTRTGTENTLRRFQHEVKCCRYLLPGHPHIVPPLGFSNCPSAPQLIFPWYSNGTILEYLGNHPAIDPLSLILDAASGIQFMHDLGIVHGDLKSANIMIDDAGRARLIDFGLSRVTTEGENGYQPPGRSLWWCAPELLVEGSLRTKSGDIYAFSSTILEILTGSYPYASMLNDWHRYAAVFSGVSPKESAGPFRVDVRDPERIWALLERCWGEAESRPEIRSVIEALEGWRSLF